MASFGEAWKDFWSMKFTGRSTRAEYWKMVVFFQAVMVLLVLLRFIAQECREMEVCMVINGIMCLFSLVMFIPSLAQLVRRLHDSGHSGLWGLLMLLPIIGWIMVLPLLLLPSENHRNVYGDCLTFKAYTTPKAPSNDDVGPGLLLLFWGVIIIVILTIALGMCSCM